MGPPDTGQARALGWPRLGLVWPRGLLPLAPLLAPASLRRNKTLGFCPMQFREYFMCNFSEMKYSRKQETGTGHIVKRLVPENANKCYKVQVKHVANGII